MTQNSFTPGSGQISRGPLTLLPPISCPRHSRPGPCPECQRMVTLRSAAHLAASVQAAQEWAQRHQAA